MVANASRKFLSISMIDLGSIVPANNVQYIHPFHSLLENPFRQILGGENQEYHITYTEVVFPHPSRFPTNQLSHAHQHIEAVMM